MPDDKKEISRSPLKINILASKSTQMEIGPAQARLPLGIEKEGDFGEIGMGVLSDGTPYLNQRGLAVLCGVENAHIGTIGHPDLPDFGVAVGCSGHVGAGNARDFSAFAFHRKGAV